MVAYTMNVHQNICLGDYINFFKSKLTPNLACLVRRYMYYKLTELHMQYNESQQEITVPQEDVLTKGAVQVKMFNPTFYQPIMGLTSHEVQAFPTLHTVRVHYDTNPISFF